jgi:hypothetical protein
MILSNQLLEELLKLEPAKKAALVDTLLASLDTPDQENQALWAQEAENRLDAFEQGKIKATSLEKILEKYY